MTPLILSVPASSRGSFRVVTRNINTFVIHRRLFSHKTGTDDPLRILFCGTDDFSKESLRALHKYSQTLESNIDTIHVVTRTDKRVGRGRKQLSIPAIKPLAEKLGLPVHQIDTFTGWQPPAFGDAVNEYCNLIIAVSFGLLIPPRILGTAKYGGLNVHPSLLPDLRGPSPIEWTILQGRRVAGLSLQTLHPSRFDEGIVLDQQSLDVPNPGEITTKELTAYLAPFGGEMLVDAIRKKLYIPPYNFIQPHKSIHKNNLVHTMKIKKKFLAIDPKTLTATDILRRNRAFGPLHAFASPTCDSDQARQINLDLEMRPSTAEDIPNEVQSIAYTIPNGVPYAVCLSHENINESNRPLIVNAKEDDIGGSRQIVIPKITVASMARGPGAAAAARAKFMTEPVAIGRFKLYRFCVPLSAESSPTEMKMPPENP